MRFCIFFAKYILLTKKYINSIIKINKAKELYTMNIFFKDEIFKLKNDFKTLSNNTEFIPVSIGKDFGLGSYISAFSLNNVNAERKETQPIVADEKILATEYSLPLKRDDFLFVTSPFGVREDPLDPSKKQMHSGMDIRCDKEILMATESNGKVVKVAALATPVRSISGHPQRVPFFTFCL